MERGSLSSNFSLGAKIPKFNLPATDGVNYTNDYFNSAVASLVVFSCNHCPYVQGSELELIRIQQENAGAGLRTLVINSNDPIQYPDDSFEKMKIKAKKLNVPYPYLFDESQAVAKLFDAACTPECYLFNKNGELVYHGVIKDNPKDADNRQSIPLETAVKQVLKGLPVEPSFVHPLGCSIKWKS